MTADKLELIRQQSMEQYGFGPAAMKKVKVCTQCGNPSPSDERFCRECGYRLPEKTLYDIYKERHVCCPNCDTVLSDLRHRPFGWNELLSAMRNENRNR